MLFSVLGPIEVSVDGAQVGLGGRRQLALLSLFLARPNRVLSRTTLVDELLADIDPTSAEPVLRVQISRLRSALSRAGDLDRITTAPGGYVFHLEPGECDAAILAADADRARSAWAAGDVREALALWRRAEALWRGDPYGELADEPYLRAEVQRLRELREVVTDERLDAEVGSGGALAALPELEARATANPLRERPQAQLMRALHCVGRSAEALEVYRAHRVRMVDELALEPSRSLMDLHRAIIRGETLDDLSPAVPQAGAIVPPGLPPAPEAPAVRPGEPDPQAREPDSPLGDTGSDEPVSPAPIAVRDRVTRAWPTMRSRRAGLVLTGLALAASVAAVLPSAPKAESTDRSAPASAGLLIELGDDGAPHTRIPLDAEPGQLVSGFGALWVLEPSKGLLTRVDPVAGRVVTALSIGSRPSRLVAGAKDLWVGDAVDHTLSRVDPATNSVTQIIDVGVDPASVVETADSVWAADTAHGTVVRFDPATGRARSPVALAGPASSLTVVGGEVWAASESARTLTRIDAVAGRANDTIDLDVSPRQIRATGKDLWVLDALGASLSRVDTEARQVTATVAVPGQPTELVVAPGILAAADRGHGTVTRVVADTRGIGAVAPAHVLGRAVTSITAGDHVWVAAGSPLVDHRGGALTVALDLAVDTLDPASSNSGGVPAPQFLGLTNDTLVTLDHTGGAEGNRMVPDLALEVPRPQEGGLRYTFHLRPGIRYSTGRPLTASDVRTSLERLFALRSAGAAYYSAVVGADACTAKPDSCDLRRGVEADDASGSVTFHLARPDPDFLFKLTMVYAMVLPADTPRRESRDPLPATGPYVITGYQPKQDVSLARNPAFEEWATAAQPTGMPDTITLRLGGTPAQAVAGTASGQVDFFSSVGGADGLDPSTFPDPSRVRVNPTMITQWAGLNVNAPPFNDIRARRALNLALDRGRIAAQEGGPNAAVPTCQILPPALSGYRRYCPWTAGPTPDGMWHGPDLERARQLVQESGTAGMQVFVWNAPEPRNLLLETNVVVDALNAIGYHASLKILPENTYYTYTNDSRNKAQVIDGGWGADYPSASWFFNRLTCRYFVPGDGVATTNLVEFCDPEFDRAVDEAATLAASDPAAAADRYAELDRRLTDLAIWLPTVTPTYIDLWSARVRNYTYHPVWGALIDQLWLT